MTNRTVAFINPEPHFFQPLLQNFVTNFSLPESFVKYLANVKEVKKNDKKIAFLKERREKTYWKVELCSSDDDQIQGVYHFRDGWQEFCKHHSLEVGDFLVFQHKGHLVFHVSIFDPSSCQSHRFSSSPSMPNFPAAVDHTSFIKIGSHKVDSLAPVKATFKPRGYPYFQAVVKKYWCRSGVMVPLKFARENVITKKKSWKMAMVIDTKGKSWNLPLSYSSKRSAYVSIGRWSSFHFANSLQPHLHVVFELIRTTKNHPVFNFYKLS